MKDRNGIVRSMLTWELSTPSMKEGDPTTTTKNRNIVINLLFISFATYDNTAHPLISFEPWSGQCIVYIFDQHHSILFHRFDSSYHTLDSFCAIVSSSSHQWSYSLPIHSDNTMSRPITRESYCALRHNHNTHSRPLHSYGQNRSIRPGE